MVKTSLDAPTVYAAVDLNAALESALKKQESELREMELRKRELEELSTHHHFRPSDEITTFKIIKSVGELVGVELPLAKSAQEEILMVVPQQLVTIARLFGVTQEVGKFIARGGSVRGVTDFSYPGVELMQDLLNIGEDWRHFDQYRGISFIVTDRKTSLTSINLDIQRISLNERIAVLWSDDPTYAEYLRGTFDVLWNQSIPSAQRIQELEQVEQQRLP
jgi:sugar-specific transcriptional regulator TrmB